MGGVAERTEVGIVRRDEKYSAPGHQQAMEFLHCADDVGDVLDDVHGPQRCKGVVAERIREAVKIAQDVRAAGGVAIDADGARMLLDAAANV